MPDAALFDLGPKKEPGLGAAEPGVPRVSRPVRNQVEIVYTDLDSLIPDEHQVRMVWAYVESADLSALYDRIRAVEGHAGRCAIDPRILLALWLYATLDGIGSARALAKLCEDHIAYRWLCGGVSVNYHTLADFRVESGAVLDQLLTDSVARLRASGLVTLNRVAHDGMRVRASAGSGSFRREATLQRFQEEAAQQVVALKRELEEDAGASDRRRKAARARAARERLERVEEALRQYPAVHARKKHDKEQTRVSVSDPDARHMHMPDGGCRPAYNVQFTTDTGSQVIVDAAVIQSGSDHGQLQPATERVEERFGTKPKEVLTDGGFAKAKDIEDLAKATPPCLVYAPPTELKTHDGKAIPPRPDEPAEVQAWRARMQTEEAKQIYKERASTAECVNALAHNRGLQQFVVRGIGKVGAVVLLFALAHNVIRTAALLGSFG